MVGSLFKFLNGVIEREFGNNLSSKKYFVIRKF